MGFGLVIGFIEQLQDVTTRNYSAVANLYTLQFIAACIKPFQSAVFSAVDLYQLPTVNVPLTLGSRTVPMPQLLTATACSN
jgi:hypothetical protein